MLKFFWKTAKGESKEHGELHIYGYLHLYRRNCDFCSRLLSKENMWVFNVVSGWFIGTMRHKGSKIMSRCSCGVSSCRCCDRWLLRSFTCWASFPLSCCFPFFYSFIWWQMVIGLGGNSCLWSMVVMVGGKVCYFIGNTIFVVIVKFIFCE